MQCIVCNNNLNQKYYLSKKQDMKVYFCHDHKTFCNNDCINYECQDNICLLIN